jgi:hypothetical protein
MAAIGLLVNFWYGPDLRKSLWWHGHPFRVDQPICFGSCGIRDNRGLMDRRVLLIVFDAKEDQEEMS